MILETNNTCSPLEKELEVTGVDITDANGAESGSGRRRELGQRVGAGQVLVSEPWISPRATGVK